jgi:hypothetical protein
MSPSAVQDQDRVYKHVTGHAEIAGHHALYSCEVCMMDSVSTLEVRNFVGRMNNAYSQHHAATARFQALQP